MSRLWNLLVYGRIDGGIGWCGQDGYWWVKPCPHYFDEEVGRGHGGCGWFDGQRTVLEPLDPAAPVRSEEPG